MLNSLSKRIAGFLLSQNCFEEELLPVYVYGTELFLSSLLGVFLVIIASLITGSLQNGILFLLAFIFLRLFTGGLHCNSYVTCNTVMVLTFLSAVITENLISRLPYSETLYCLMMVLSVTATIIFAPVSNPNKEIPQSQKRKYSLISSAILLAHFILHTALSRYIGTEIIIVTDFISSAYIIIGLLKNKTERRISHETQKEHS